MKAGSGRGFKIREDALIQCPSCHGLGLLKRTGPHTYMPTVNVIYTRTCINCGGTGKVPEPVIDNKTKAAGGE